jgi:GTP-sensing pleiotropic transcriptional regulator CodY
MAYALGRGLEYSDTEAVDQIVDRLEKENGRFSALLTGIIQSAPFQERRNTSSAGGVRLSQTATAKAPGESPPLSN